MPAIDRYIAQHLAKPFLATTTIIILLLSLENSRRLMGLLDHVQRPFAVLLELMAYLVPEYLGIGWLVAVFLSVALVFRGFALSGELDIFGSVGLSPWRLLRVPLLLGLGVAMLYLGLRGYVEPLGERRLDALGSAIKVGDMGVSIRPGEFIQPSPDVTLRVDGVDRASGIFRGVFVRSRDVVVVARSAHMVNGGGGGVTLQLFDGHVVRQRPPGGVDAGAFAEMQMPLRIVGPAAAQRTARHRNDRRLLGDLIRSAAATAPSRDRAAARAALGGRFAAAGFLLIIPFFGLLLGVPHRRSTSALGLVAGLMLIVAFIQLDVAIEDAAAPWAPWAQGGVLAAFALLARLLFAIQSREGLGAIDGRLAAMSRPFARCGRTIGRWMRWDRVMMRLPVPARPDDAVGARRPRTAAPARARQPAESALAA